MRKQWVVVVLVVLVVLSFSARCASIAHGRYQHVSVHSTPPGAAVRVDCGDAPSFGGVTPVMITVRRRAEHCGITLSKAGYADQAFTFTRAHSRVGWANLGSGLLLGMAAGIGLTGPLDTSNRPNEIAIAGIAAGTGIGLAIDGSTGAIFRQVPDSVEIRLAETESVERSK